MNELPLENLPNLVNLIFESDEVIDFTVRMRLRNYIHLSYTQQNEISDMFWKAIIIIREQLRNGDELQKISKYISEYIFHRNDSNHWLTKFTNSYRIGPRISSELFRLKPLIRGERVLDFGAGSGDLAVSLSKAGYEMLIADVIDYRSTEAQNLEFIRISDSQTALPIKDRIIDTSLVMSTLHHIPTGSVSRIIKELTRVSKRVVIKEDICGLNNNYDNGLIESDDLLKEYSNFTLDKQKLILAASDIFSNYFIHGRVEMPLEFSFNSIEEWFSIFKDVGVNNMRFIPIGMKRGLFSGANHGYFVLNCWD